MNSEMSQMFVDLEIDPSLLMKDPQGFMDQIYAKGMELVRELELPNSLADQQKRFKDQALANTAAKEKAEEVYKELDAIISKQTPEVVANLLPMMAQLTAGMNGMVSSMAIRIGDPKKRSFSKKTLHMMYVDLRKVQEVAYGFVKLAFPDQVKVKTLPAKSGNWNDSAKSGVKIYEFFLTKDGEKNAVRYVNPYSVATLLELSITHYMDLPDALEAAKFKLNGYSIRMEEI